MHQRSPVRTLKNQALLATHATLRTPSHQLPRTHYTKQNATAANFSTKSITYLCGILYSYAPSVWQCTLRDVQAGMGPACSKQPPSSTSHADKGLLKSTHRYLGKRAGAPYLACAKLGYISTVSLAD